MLRELGGAPFESPYAVQDRGNHIFIAYGGVDHQVIKRPGWPICAEIVLHKKNALAIYGVHQIFGVV